MEYTQIELEEMLKEFKYDFLFGKALNGAQEIEMPLSVVEEYKEHIREMKRK